MRTFLQARAFGLGMVSVPTLVLSADGVLLVRAHNSRALGFGLAKFGFKLVGLVKFALRFGVMAKL